MCFNIISNGGAKNVGNENIHKIIIDGSMLSLSLNICEGNLGAMDF